jgi:hypothetical protein
VTADFETDKLKSEVVYFTTEGYRSACLPLIRHFSQLLVVFQVRTACFLAIGFLVTFGGLCALFFIIFEFSGYVINFGSLDK